MSRVLLTGAAGLVGSAILTRLLDDGHDVVAVDRLAPTMEHPRLRWLYSDFDADPAEAAHSLPLAEVVVHAGAAVRLPPEVDELATYRRTNAELAELLFKRCARERVGTVIFLSSLGVLRRPPEPVIRESDPVGPTTAYAASKLWGELALAKYAPGAFRGLTLRLSSPIAFDLSRLHDTVVKKWITASQTGSALVGFGTGARTQDFVATDDIAQAVALAIRQDRAHGIYHVASGTELSMRQLAELVGRRFGVTVQWRGDDPEESVRWPISIERARQDLGYRPGWSSRAAIAALLESIR